MFRGRPRYIRMWLRHALLYIRLTYYQSDRAVLQIMRLDKDTFGNGLKSRFLDNRQATMYLKT